MSRVYLSLGSNLGKKDENIERTLHLLSKKVQIVKRSSFYEAEPGGDTDQPCFLYRTAEGKTSLPPFELLAFTQGIEHKMKRVKTVLKGPRNIDIDILLYNDEIIHTPELVIPHPRILDRAFVLEPLCEIAPELIVLGRSVTDVLKTLEGVESGAPEPPILMDNIKI